MASRRITRSTANVQREPGESEVQFWSSIPDLKPNREGAR